MDTLTTDIDRLLQQVPLDDPSISEALVQQNAGYLYRIAFSILGNSPEAEDAVQETFIRAATNMHRYQPGTKLKTWLATIVVNISRSMLCKRTQRSRLVSLLGGRWHRNTPILMSEDSVIQKEEIHRLRRAIDALDEKHRLVIILRYIHNLPVIEIATILGIKEGTVHSRIYYAHRLLRKELAPEMETDR